MIETLRKYIKVGLVTTLSVLGYGCSTIPDTARDTKWMLKSWVGSGWESVTYTIPTDYIDNNGKQGSVDITYKFPGKDNREDLQYALIHFSQLVGLDQIVDYRSNSFVNIAKFIDTDGNRKLNPSELEDFRRMLKKDAKDIDLQRLIKEAR